MRGHPFIAVVPLLQSLGRPWLASGRFPTVSALSVLLRDFRTGRLGYLRGSEEKSSGTLAWKLHLLSAPRSNLRPSPTPQQPQSGRVCFLRVRDLVESLYLEAGLPPQLLAISLLPQGRRPMLSLYVSSCQIARLCPAPTV